MCPEAMCPETSPIGRQRGFLLPLALFMMLVLGLLALGLWRVSAQTNIGAVQELISVQAFYAAESGAQEGMSLLFYPDASSRATVDGQCAAINLLRGYDNIPGLNNCSAQISCARQEMNETSFYTITSHGQCQAGSLQAQRTIEVSALMAEE